MTYQIAYLPGDGIGPEVLEVARRTLESEGFEGVFIEAPVGWAEWVQNGDPLPERTLEICRQADAILFGAITSKSEREAQAELSPNLQGQGLRYRSPILRLRQALDLYANVRPIQGGPYDLTIFRENTEGLYTGKGQHPVSKELAQAFELDLDAAIDLRVITPKGIRRIIQRAIDHAIHEHRSKITLVEKANVLRHTGNLVLDTFHDLTTNLGLETEVLHVDAACAHLVRSPKRFDVVVATNLFGDILSDLAAELAGGLPRAASANLGDHHMLFEPVHGSAPDIAGKGLADPAGAIAAARWMQRALERRDPTQL